MNKMEIAICSGNENIIIWVKNTLDEYTFDKSDKYELRFFADYEGLETEIRSGYRADLIFLSFMPEDIGIVDSDSFRELYDNCALIFIKSLPKAAEEEYSAEMRAILQIPFRLCNIGMLLNNTDMIHSLDKNNYQKIPVHIRGTVFHIICTDVVYIESQKHNVILHMQNRSIKTVGKLDDYENLLKENRSFLRCHQSFLVNMDYIENAKGYMFFLKNDSAVPIRKRDTAAIKSAYLSYKLESL